MDDETKRMLDEYRRIREIRESVHRKIIATLDRGAFGRGAKRLGMLKGKTIVFETEDEASVLADHCIYDEHIDGMNAVQRFLATSPPSDPFARYAIEGLSRAQYGLVAVDEVVPSVGVRVTELFRSSSHLVLDIGMSETAEKGYAQATRLVPYDGFWTLTGAGLPLDVPTAEEILGAMQVKFGHHGSIDDLTIDERDEVATISIRTCLRHGASARVHYAEPGEEVGEWALPSRALGGHRSLGSAMPVRALPKIGRNEPCPCGSGKKYKKCHGLL